MNLERLYYKIISPNRSILLEPAYWMLRAMSFVYALAMKLRAMGYRAGWLPSRKLNGWVISVGNLTLGGTGKTPMTLWIAQTLKDRGRKPAILSRGYKGNADGTVNVVSDGIKVLLSPESAGDEPVMMAQKLKGVPILVGVDRYLSGKHALEHFGVDTLILDDGFQHLSLHRDCNILLLDDANPFGNGRVFPAGHLREPLDALSRADLICYTRAQAGLPRMKVRFTKPVNEIQTSPRIGKWIYLETGENLSQDAIKNKPVAVFCGIARPDDFVKLLTEDGIQVVSRFDFSDHYRYSSQDCRYIQDHARRCNAEFILTTEKDAVKLNVNSWDPPLIVASIELDFINGEDIVTQAILGAKEKSVLEGQR